MQFPVNKYFNFMMKCVGIFLPGMYNDLYI